MGGSLSEDGPGRLPVRPDIGAAAAAGLTDKPGLDIRQHDVITPAIGAEPFRIAAAGANCSLPFTSGSLGFRHAGPEGGEGAAGGLGGLMQ